jgi:hypothetical protein
MSQDSFNDTTTASAQPTAKDATFFYTILTSMNNKPDVGLINFPTILLLPRRFLTSPAANYQMFKSQRAQRTLAFNEFLILPSLKFLPVEINLLIF